MPIVDDESERQQLPILPYGTAPRRSLRKLALRTFLIIGILVVSVGIAELALEWLYPPVLFRTMWVREHDQDGMACIDSVPFTLLFEGQSFGHITLTSAGWEVDGRSERYAPWKQYSQSVTLGSGSGQFTSEGTGWLSGGGVSYLYSQRNRTLTLTYVNRRVIYCDWAHRLTVDGHVYSTASGPVTLLVKRDGSVVEQQPTTAPDMPGPNPR